MPDKAPYGNCGCGAPPSEPCYLDPDGPQYHALRELVDAGEPFVGVEFPAEKMNATWLRVVNRWQAAMNDARKVLERAAR